MSKNSIVLIHGAFAGPWCMDLFAGFFRERGWDVHTPALRLHEEDPKEDPEKALIGVSITDHTDDLATYIDTLDSRPVVLGHAVGGIMAQQLAARGLARAAILLNPNAPYGVLPATDDERAVAKGMMSAGAIWETVMHVDFDLIATYAFNKLDPETQHAVFDRLGAESGQLMFEMFFWMFDDRKAISVDVDKVDCPVLVVSGAEDRAVRPATGEQIAALYGERGTHLLVQGQAHFIFMEPGWDRVAADCLDWIEHNVA